MLAVSQKSVLVNIIKSWRLTRSNFVLVCPPMNGERQVIRFLTAEREIYEVIGEHYHTLNIASLDTADFRSELVFAKSVARKWGVEAEVSLEEDPRTILELACAEVVRLKRSPILIIHRFHEALDKLGEDIGSTLRDLEHQYYLKTVVTMPVSLTVLRERWDAMDPNKAPFLASDWGQGHRSKFIKGYTFAEIAAIGAARGLGIEACQVLYKATGGIVDLIDILVEEIQGKRGKGLTLYLQQRSPELCKRILDWLDPINASHTYKKALVSLMNPSFFPNAYGFITDHDWSSILLSKEKALSFDMLAWAAASSLSKTTESGWSDRLRQLYQQEAYKAALAMIEVMYGADKVNINYWSALRDLTIFCEATSDVFSASGKWMLARRKLEKLIASNKLPAPVLRSFAPLETWRGICELLSEFLSEKTVRSDLRIENFICSKGRHQLVLPFMQLIVLRLNASTKHGTFQAFQSVMTAPESLIQVYAFYELGICYWNFGGLSEELSGQLEVLARKPYRIANAILGYSDLVHLVALRSQGAEGAHLLIHGQEELDNALKQYEVRKESSHSTAFADVREGQNYQEFLKKLLERYSKCNEAASSSLELISPAVCALALLDYAPRSALFLPN